MTDVRMKKTGPYFDKLRRTNNQILREQEEMIIDYGLESLHEKGKQLDQLLEELEKVRPYNVLSPVDDYLPEDIEYIRYYEPKEFFAYSAKCKAFSAIAKGALTFATEYTVPVNSEDITYANLMDNRFKYQFGEKVHRANFCRWASLDQKSFSHKYLDDGHKSAGISVNEVIPTCLYFNFSQLDTVRFFHQCIGVHEISEYGIVGKTLLHLLGNNLVWGPDYEQCQYNDFIDVACKALILDAEKRQITVGEEILPPHFRTNLWQDRFSRVLWHHSLRID